MSRRPLAEKIAGAFPVIFVTRRKKTWHNDQNEKFTTSLLRSTVLFGWSWYTVVFVLSPTLPVGGQVSVILAEHLVQYQ